MLASIVMAALATVALPEPIREGHSLERALAERRTVREFAAAPIRLADIAQLAWAAQGVTAPDGRRTAPSAGALYPLEIYIVAARVDGLAPGVYHYEPVGHRLVPTADGDRIEVGHAAQNVLLQATALGLAAAPVGAFDERQ